MVQPTSITLEEYKTTCFPREGISYSIGETLYRNYGRQVDVEFPNPKTYHQWKLTPQGWVGYIPLSPGLSLVLAPRVELDNLFGMLEYAYRLESFRFLDGLVDCKSLEEFYERLARILALRVLDRHRKGLYRAYLARTEQLSYVTGRLDMQRLAQRPWDTRPECHYEEHTPNVEENQILACALHHILRSGMCTERALPTVRQAYRTVRGFTAVKPITAQDCVGRLYNRLNDDYHPMHALCRFFLEHSGPSHEVGDRSVLPFLVHMPHLYELFVAEWLKHHLPQDLVRLEAHDKVIFGAEQTLHFDIDLTLYDVETNRALCVMDTKYKVPEKPSNADISQVVTYAEIKRCQDAILIYPTPLKVPLDEWFGQIRVRSLVFSTDGDLEQAGEAFAQDLSSSVGLGWGAGAKGRITDWSRKNRHR
jgi:5-methylcytosine-specific restriction enzyme subunit McrC